MWMVAWLLGLGRVGSLFKKWLGWRVPVMVCLGHSCRRLLLQASQVKREECVQQRQQQQQPAPLYPPRTHRLWRLHMAVRKLLALMILCQWISS